MRLPMRFPMRLIARLFALIALLTAGVAIAQYVPNQATGRQPIPSQTNPENLLYLDLSTGGRVIIWLRPDAAPQMVTRVKTLARQHFYDGLVFHRVIDGFMAQGGDPRGTGEGGSTLPNLPAEFNFLPHTRGAVAAARTENDTATANSQFFIMFQPRLSLDRHYTVFGRVIAGMDYVDAIQRGEPPASPTRILHAYVAADHPPGYVPAPPVAVAPPASLGAPVVLPGTRVPRPAATPAARAAPRRR